MSIPRIEFTAFAKGRLLAYETATTLFSRLQQLIDRRFLDPSLPCTTDGLWHDVLGEQLLMPGEYIATCSNSDGCRIVIGPMLDMGDMITVITYPLRMREGELEIRIISQQ